MRQISSVCCSMFLYKIHCKKDVTQLIKKCTVRDEPVLHAVHQKSLFTEQRTKILVKFLISEKQSSPWTLIITGSICASFPLGRYLSRRCALFLSFAYVISVLKIRFSVCTFFSRKDFTGKCGIFITGNFFSIQYIFLSSLRIICISKFFTKIHFRN